MRRWGNFQEFIQEDFSTALELIEFAEEEEIKEHLYKFYLTKVPHMDKDNFITFDDFYAKTKQKVTIKELSREEIYEKFRKE